MESLDSSRLLSENPNKATHGAGTTINNISRYVYQKHHLHQKQKSSFVNNNLFRLKGNPRSRSIDAEIPKIFESSLSPCQIISHATIALKYHNKELSSVPHHVLKYKSSLLILDLSCNNISQFPTEIVSLSKLKSLKLDSNKLRVIPDDISLLNHLETLSVASNFITCLPRAITTLAKTLTTLNVSDNYIERFPEEITELKNLKTLWIHKNWFVTLPAKLNILNSLREISLEWFKYSFPPLSMLQNDPNRESIQKMFKLCALNLSSGKSEVSFETFVEHFSVASKSLLSFRDSSHRNILHICTLEEEIGIIRYVATHRPDLLDQMDEKNHTPLTLSILEGKDISAKALLANQANPNIGGSTIGPALHIALSKFNIGLVKDLLKCGANVNGLDLEGNTPLHIISSIFCKNVGVAREICSLLLERGADPNINNNDGWAPVHLAIRRGQTECLKWIIESNKYQLDPKKLFDLNIKGGGDRWTPLHLAAGFSSYEGINLLTDSAVDLFAVTKTGKTARDVAVNNVLICKVLKKFEDNWIHSHLFGKLTVERQMREISASSNVLQLKHKIQNCNTIGTVGTTWTYMTSENTEEDNLEKEEESKRVLKCNSNINQREKLNKRKPILKIDDCEKDLSRQTEQSTMIGDVDETVETKETTRVILRSPNNIQKIQIAQNYREHLMKLSGEFDFSSPVSSFNEPYMNCHMLSNNPVKNLISPQHLRRTAKTFIFPSDFNNYIKNFENYIEEIKGYQDILIKEAGVTLAEKLKLVFYMQALHMKINGLLGKMNSKMIPIELFILCEHVEDELKKGKDKFKKGLPNHNYDIIPRTLLFIFENLDSKKSCKNALVKNRISRLFGDFKYEPAKHFLKQVVENKKENYVLRVAAKEALSFINKRGLEIKPLNNDKLAQDRFVTALVSPTYENGKKDVKKGLLVTTSLNLPNNKINKRTLSCVGAAKSENIEEEEDTLKIGEQDYFLVNSYMKGREEHISTGFRTVQSPLPSKFQSFSNKNVNTDMQITLDSDEQTRPLEIRKITKKNNRGGSYFTKV